MRLSLMIGRFHWLLTTENGLCAPPPELVWHNPRVMGSGQDDKDWLDGIARLQAHEEHRSEADRDRQLHCARLIHANGARFVTLLRDAARRLTHDYCTLIAARQLAKKVDFVEDPSGGFFTEQSKHPATAVNCEPNIAGHTIVLKYSHTSALGVQTDHRDEALQIRVNSDDQLYLCREDDPSDVFANVDAAAKWILEPVFASKLRD